jgi:hypothetical protein
MHLFQINSGFEIFKKQELQKYLSMREYVTAPGTTISERLHHKFPGKFNNKTKYLSFRVADELLEKIYLLQSDKSVLYEMMTNQNQILFVGYICETSKFYIRYFIYCAKLSNSNFCIHFIPKWEKTYTQFLQ